MVASEKGSVPMYKSPLRGSSRAWQRWSFTATSDYPPVSEMFERGDVRHPVRKASVVSTKPTRVQDRYFAVALARTAPLVFCLGTILAWGQSPAPSKAESEAPDGTRMGNYRVVKISDRIVVFPPNVEESSPTSVFTIFGIVPSKVAPNTCIAHTNSGTLSLKVVDGKLPNPLPPNPAASSVNPLIDGLVAQVTVSIESILKSETQSSFLRGEYHEFAELLSKLPAGCLPPDGIELLLTRLTESVPSSFPNSLLLAYGLDSTEKRGRILVQPGMRLRVENATYQRAPTKEGIYGYVSTGSQFLNVNRRPAADNASLGYLNFDSFFGQLGYLDAPPDFKSQLACGDKRLAPNWLSNALDLHLRAHERLYYGLVYPVRVVDSRVEQQDDPCDATAHPILIGANTITSLWAAMDHTSPLPEKCPVTDTDCPTYNVFIGRSTVIPEIQVHINGQSAFVPVGTTIRNIVDSDTNLSFPEVAAQLRLRRRYRSRYSNVVWETAEPNDSMILDLPLLKGDILSIGLDAASVPPIKPAGK